MLTNDQKGKEKASAEVDGYSSKQQAFLNCLNYLIDVGKSWLDIAGILGFNSSSLKLVLGHPSTSASFIHSTASMIRQLNSLSQDKAAREICKNTWEDLKSVCQELGSLSVSTSPPTEIVSEEQLFTEIQKNGRPLMAVNSYSEESEAEVIKVAVQMDDLPLDSNDEGPCLAALRSQAPSQLGVQSSPLIDLFHLSDEEKMAMARAEAVGMARGRRNALGDHVKKTNSYHPLSEDEQVRLAIEMSLKDDRLRLAMNASLKEEEEQMALALAMSFEEDNEEDKKQSKRTELEPVDGEKERQDIEEEDSRPCKDASKGKEKATKKGEKRLSADKQEESFLLSLQQLQMPEANDYRENQIRSCYRQLPGILNNRSIRSSFVDRAVVWLEHFVGTSYLTSQEASMIHEMLILLCFASKNYDKAIFYCELQERLLSKQKGRSVQDFSTVYHSAMHYGLSSHLALALDSTSDDKLRKEWYEKAAASFGEAVAIAIHLVENDPEKYPYTACRSQFSCGLLHLRQKSYADACQLFFDAIQSVSCSGESLKETFSLGNFPEDLFNFDGQFAAFLRELSSEQRGSIPLFIPISYFILNAWKESPQLRADQISELDPFVCGCLQSFERTLVEHPESGILEMNKMFERVILSQPGTELSSRSKAMPAPYLDPSLETFFLERGPSGRMLLTQSSRRLFKEEEKEFQKAIEKSIDESCRKRSENPANSSRLSEEEEEKALQEAIKESLKGGPEKRRKI